MLACSSALDAAESRGHAGVRAAQRELARMAEREVEHVERWIGCEREQVPARG